MFAILKEKRLRWLGHVQRMQEGRIPKYLLYGELATGIGPTGRPKLRYKDVLKRDLKDCDVGVSRETIAAGRVKWHSSVKISESKRELIWEEKRVRIRQRAQTSPKQDKTLPSSVRNATVCASRGSDCVATHGAAVEISIKTMHKSFNCLPRQKEAKVREKEMTIYAWNITG